MEDLELMRAVIEESKKSKDEDGRNHPRVGAIIVKGGEIIATAHRGEFDKSHAEYIALKKVEGISLEDATVYTTLEPCTSRNHPKVSCAERLIKANVGHVVIGMLDPNPDISGRGVRVLRHKGIKLSFFPDELVREIQKINEKFDAQYPIVDSAAQKLSIGSFQQQLETIYGTANSRLTPEYIYSYFHRSVDYLITTIRKKAVLGELGVMDNTLEFMRVFSWLTTLATKLGCNLQEAFFRRFPGICPYCIENNCICNDTGKKPKPFLNIERKVVTHSPQGIERILTDKYQRIQSERLSFDFAISTISSIYPINKIMWGKTGSSPHIFKILEELGEVHEAISRYSTDMTVGKKSVEEELSDVLAWLLSAWDIISKGLSLDTALFNYYYKGCPVCHSIPCKCPQYSGRSVNIVDSKALNTLSTLLTGLHSVCESETTSRLMTSVEEAIKIQSDRATRILMSEIFYAVDVIEKKTKPSDPMYAEVLSAANKILSFVEPIVNKHTEKYYQPA